jgi:endonuclease-3
LKNAELMAEKNRTSEIFRILKEHYPSARVALNFSNPLELLVATILSAQCTDKRVNEVTSTLFKKYRTPDDYAKADLDVLEQDIRPTGFYRNKARYLKACCSIIAEKYGGEVPKTMEDLLKLPGVARKTANIVLSNAYGVVEGIAVDTHVKRVSRRLGLTSNTDQDKIEKDLMQIFPKEAWFSLNYLLIELGRGVCVAGRPRCEKCPVVRLCPTGKLSIEAKH